MMNIDFTGKTAVITGAARGLNQCIAILFAELGADVWVGDLLPADETVAKVKAFGRHSGYVVTDVSKYDQMKNLRDTVIAAEGKIDIWVNGAGIVFTEGFLDISPEQVQKITDVNVLSVSHGCQVALEHMNERKTGRILNFASIAGRGRQQGLPHYGMTKAAVISLTQSAAFVGAPNGVMVNAIAPGIIRTAMWEKILDARSDNPEAREIAWNNSLKAMIPTGIAQEPIDIAWGAAFLCSDFARYITGQTLNVCGGARMN